MDLISLLDSVNAENLIANGGLWILIIMTLIQITPIKVNPWSWIAHRIGKAINGEVLARVTDLEGKMEKHIEDEKEKAATSARIRILMFNDEILHGTKHTKEHFDQTLIDINMYECYCNSHPNYKNDIASFAIANIRKTYQGCMNEGTFL